MIPNPLCKLTYVLFRAPLAQLDRASGYEPEGREFESLRARHLFNPILDWRLSKSTNCPCSVRVFPKTPLPSMSVTGLFRQLLPRGLRTYPRSREARALWLHPQSFEQ